MSERVVVAGAGGFIGGHLANRLARAGNSVVAVDVKPRTDWYQTPDSVEIVDKTDLAIAQNCLDVTDGASAVYMLAADMGGMGFIETHKLDCMLSVLPSTHMLLAAAECGVQRYFYASSACVYAADKQADVNVAALKESDAYPAMPEDGYGWEKLFTERMCRHFSEDRGLVTRVARFHNVYGPCGTYAGGREKAPAAICRKVIEAQLSGEHEIEIWGDGEQTRSFMFIDDCVEGIDRIMRSGCEDPLNLGSDRLVSINDLVSIVEDIAGITLKRTYNLDAPKGVRGRNSDNTLLKRATGWEPQVSLEDGMMQTYAWILREMTLKK